MSGLFNGQPVPGVPQGTDTASQYPLWLQQYVYNLGNTATNLASQPYSQFPGQQVASPSEDTQVAWTLAQQNAGNYQPALNSAYAQTAAGSTPLSAGDIQKYMNPYTDNVVGALQNASNMNFNTNTLPAIQSRFVSAGQSRSPQEMQAANNALYLNNQALDQSVSGALSQGYQSAVQTAQGQQALQLQGGAQMGALGQLQQQLAGYDVGQLAAAGQGQDSVNQSNINAAMNNFYSQQQWPYQNLAYASNIIRGQPVASNSQTVGVGAPSAGAYTSSPLSNFIGTTLGAASLGKSLTGSSNSGNSGSNLFGLAEGGHVNDNAALNRYANRLRQGLRKVA